MTLGHPMSCGISCRGDRERHGIGGGVSPSDGDRRLRGPEENQHHYGDERPDKRNGGDYLAAIGPGPCAPASANDQAGIG